MSKVRGHRAPDPDQYTKQIDRLLHDAMDRLIELASVMNAHHDILDDEVEEGSAEQLLRAQIGIENAEDEINLTQELIQVTSKILIERHARTVIIDDILSGALAHPSGSSELQPSSPHTGGPDLSSVPEGGSDLPDPTGA